MLKTESFRPPFKSKGGFPPGRKSLGGTPAGDTEVSCCAVLSCAVLSASSDEHIQPLGSIAPVETHEKLKS